MPVQYLFGLRYLEVSRITKMPIVVIAKDVRKDNPEELSIWVIIFTKDWVVSNVVWRQLKAIVKPNVTTIKKRSCEINSFLY